MKIRVEVWTQSATQRHTQEGLETYGSARIRIQTLEIMREICGVARKRADSCVYVRPRVEALRNELKKTWKGVEY